MSFELGPSPLFFSHALDRTSRKVFYYSPYFRSCRVGCEKLKRGRKCDGFGWWLKKEREGEKARWGGSSFRSQAVKIGPRGQEAPAVQILPHRTLRDQARISDEKSTLTTRSV